MSNSPSSHESSFNLHSLAEELRQAEPYRRDGHTARTLVRTPDLRVVLIAMKGGSHIAEHHANESASVHTIFGHLRLRMPGGTIELPAGQLFLVERGLQHGVEAAADSAFVLTLGWRGEH